MHECILKTGYVLSLFWKKRVDVGSRGSEPTVR